VVVGFDLLAKHFISRLGKSTVNDGIRDPPEKSDISGLLLSIEISSA
jgi:hypothetical protein